MCVTAMTDLILVAQRLVTVVNASSTALRVVVLVVVVRSSTSTMEF